MGRCAAAFVVTREQTVYTLLSDGADCKRDVVAVHLDGGIVNKQRQPMHVFGNALVSFFVTCQPLRSRTSLRLRRAYAQQHTCLTGKPAIFKGVQPWNSHGCFQLHGGGHAADALIGSLVVISPEPSRCLVLCLLDGFKDRLAQPFAAYGAIVTLNAAIWPRPARLHVSEPLVAFLSPFHQLSTDIVRAVIDTFCLWLAAPFNVWIERPSANWSAMKCMEHVSFRL
jgi:hypothetical protein